MRNSLIHSILGLLFVFTSCVRNIEKQTVEASDPTLELDNGVLLYQGKAFDGRITARFSNGLLQSEVEYAAGRKNGYEKHWHSDGSRATERFYTRGLKTGIHQAWWADGTPKFVYHFNEAGEYHGAVSEWYASGQRYKSFHYRDGQAFGSQKLWKEDGSIKANYEVRNGERFGLIGLKKCYTVTADSDEIH